VTGHTAPVTAEPTRLVRGFTRTTAPAETAIVAHRGAWGVAAENTLAAFENAINLGVDMIEFDVRRTGDGRLVVHHDPDRGGLPLSGVRAAALDGPQTAPPLLSDVLDLARGRIQIDIELKERGCVPDVIPLLRSFGLEWCLLTSFHDEVVAAAKAAAPMLTVGLLIGRYRRVSELFPGRRLTTARADVLVIHHRLVHTGVLRRVPLPCLVWTVNAPGALTRSLADPRVAGVITDLPQAALQTRRRLEGAVSRRTASAVPS
jgi:glycerophosphoryl diester phosphodiesterase